MRMESASANMGHKFSMGAHQCKLDQLDDGNHIFRGLGKGLMDAGYMDGQSYEQCLKMAEWHPAMAKFMGSIGANGTETQRRTFGFACLYAHELLAQPGNQMPC